MRKNILILSIICLLTITISYTYSAFKNTIKGTITATTNNWKFSVNVPSGIKENDYYKVLINGTSGSFDINLDTTGSNEDAKYTIEFNGIDNINLYTDSAYSNNINNIYEGSISKNEANTITIYYNSSSIINGYLYIKTKAKVKIGTSIYEYICNLQNNGVDTNINFKTVSSSTNGDGINIVSGTENNTYPIYYYRGNVTNNNIIYANFCWKIIRTTETGGVKILYNGVPSSGKCNNTGGASSIAMNIQYNTTSTSPIYAGYMYGQTAYTTTNLSSYRTHLSDTSVIESTNTTTETIGNKTFNIVGRHVQNAKSSNVKIKVDQWYQNNILDTSYANMLEDAVWCNDRSISTGTYSLNNVLYGDTAEFWYKAYERLYNNPSPTLTCERDIDKFTVSSSNGNGDLEYPIGLLTADEMTLAGNGFNGYSVVHITSQAVFMSMTPLQFDASSPVTYAYYVETNGRGVNTNVSIKGDVRPAVSLKNGIKINTSGDGTSDKPLLVVG